MSKSKKDVFEHFSMLGQALHDLVEHAQKSWPHDRVRVFQSSANKIVPTYEKLGQQLGHLLAQHERLSQPPRGPRGPATIYKFRARKKRR